MLCPYCAEEIKDAARKCKHCGEWISGGDDGPSQAENEKFEASDTFKMYDNYFTYKNITHYYKDIKHLYVEVSNTSINFLSTNGVNIHIWKDKVGKHLHIHKTTALFRTQQYKNFVAAGRALQEITFDQRKDEYMKELDSNGFISYPPVKFGIFRGAKLKIWPNGDIDNGKLRLNLIEAKKNGILGAGTDVNLGTYNTHDPYEVWISHTGAGVFDKKIKFKAHIDNDVILSLLTALSKR
jgi:hypothetical protein